VRPVLSFLIFFDLLATLGCAGGTQSLDAVPSDRIVCFVPGVAGDSGLYGGLKKALVESGATDLRVFTWGAPPPLFALNFQTTSIHDKAEQQLADRLTQWLHQRPGMRVDLIGHSAGGGVILGALRRLGEGDAVDHVVLLSPSVSPGYDLAPPLRRVRVRLDLFWSDRDTFFLKWRTGTFGTYDNVKTPAAGNMGFHPTTPLPPELASRLVQHPYGPQWESLGNAGGHDGSVAHDFVRQVVTPLLNAPAPSPAAATAPVTSPGAGK
jgi:pimeloyl-ACP methyl ester carboxylesterase